MKVYVAKNVHLFPEVDGPGYIIGVYSSMRRAREAAENERPNIEGYLGSGAKKAYVIRIIEFELDV